MNELFITAEQLNSDISSVVIFDCRFSLADHSLGEHLYQQGHIPGAFHMDMEKDLSGPKGLHGGRHPLPDTEAFEHKLRQCGVNANTWVIAYDDSRFAGSARLWWLLRYFGHNKVRILDGGIKSWQQAGFELSTENTSAQHMANDTGTFSAKPGALPVADQQWVKARLNDSSVTLVDAREAIRFNGEAEPVDLIAGHIPGAINAPWQQVSDSDGFIQPEELQRKIWQTLPESHEYVVYCGSGVTACVNLLSMEIAGIKNTRLYCGSWSDWISYPENPTVTVIL